MPAHTTPPQDLYDLARWLIQDSAYCRHRKAAELLRGAAKVVLFAAWIEGAPTTKPRLAVVR